jgi:hypothetical protein
MSVVNVRRSALTLARGDDPAVFAMRLYVQYLQGLFNFMPEGTFHWEPDQETTEIVIRAQAPLDLKTVGKRPAITVIMGPYQFAGIGMDNMLSWNMKTGEKKRTDLLTGHIIVYCLANSDILAMRLGHLVSHHTRANQRLLESKGGFYAIARPNGATVNSPSPPGQLVLGDPQSLVMVQVNIPFQIQWTWSSIPTRQMPQFQSLDQITSARRASDFEHVPPQTLKKLRLAMSSSDVLVRRVNKASVIGQNDGLPTHNKPVIVTVHEGIEDFQISGLESFQDD